jgi:hypothetical protein
MSKRSDGLLADMLGQRWMATHAPAAAGTIVLQSPVPTDGHTTIHLDHLSFSIDNMAAATHTVTTSVRDTSVAGTVLWSMDHLITNATSKEIVIDGIHLEASKGKALHITQNTVLASVKATVNIAGWSEQHQD